MGSTGYPGEGEDFKRMSVADKKWFIRRHEIGNSHKVLKDTIVNNVYYGVLTNSMDNGENFAVVCPFWVRDDEVILKMMDESVGPNYYDMPVSYLKLLGPTSSKYSVDWRAKVKEQAGSKSTRHAGWVYTFDKDGKFYKYPTLARVKADAQAYANRTGKQVKIIYLKPDASEGYAHSVVKPSKKSRKDVPIMKRELDL